VSIRERALQKGIEEGLDPKVALKLTFESEAEGEELYSKLEQWKTDWFYKKFPGKKPQIGGSGSPSYSDVLKMHDSEIVNIPRETLNRIVQRSKQK